MINLCTGSLIVTAEYILTGSIVLSDERNIEDYIVNQDVLDRRLIIPANKKLLINHLNNENGQITNCASLLPGNIVQEKLFPDETEIQLGIRPGKESILFMEYGKKFRTLICMDMKYAKKIDISELDFLIWMYHFTESNYENKMDEALKFSKENRIDIIISSLITDKNNGHSSYIKNGKINKSILDEGILEIDTDKKYICGI